MDVLSGQHESRGTSLPQSRLLELSATVGLLALLAVPDARAGGLWVNEFATPAMGRAGAGAEAGTVDASSALHNPATMTKLDGQRLLLGAQLVSSEIKFDIDRSSPVNGEDNGGDQGGLIPAGGIYYAGVLTDRLRFGAAVTGIAGATDRRADLPFDEQWRFAVGGNYRRANGQRISAQLVYADYGDAEIQAAGFAGEYDKFELWFFSITADWNLGRKK